MGFIILNFLLLLFIILLLLVLSGIWPPDSPWAPWWQMTPRAIREMCVLVKMDSSSYVYDLGCGTGNALIIAAKEFGARGLGIEIDPLRYVIAKINIKRFGVEENISLIKGNLFDISFTNANVLFIYLVPSALKKLAPKCLKELKRGTMLVSYQYDLPKELFKSRLKLIKHDEKNFFYVYRLMK